MKESLHIKLQQLALHHEELAALLADPSVINNQEKFRKLSKEYAELTDVVNCFQQYELQATQLEQAKTLLAEESDAELKEMAQEEMSELNEQQEALTQQLRLLLLPSDPEDRCNVFLEIRAGTGGDEAAIFAGDLFRMYSRYAEQQGWTLEIINTNHGEHGGYKEIIARIIGQAVYSHLKFESGAHRVQRIPETESQGRIHTSACTVAILPEPETVDSIEINPADLRTDTFRASGAGGQHVNRTDSAIRITHIPTGTVVECQDERSQHKNRARAMSLLSSRLLTAERERHHSERAATRRSLVGSGDRSERIRTYNYPQGRITDHRINLTLYKLTLVMEGELQQVIDPLRQEHQADLLAANEEK